MRNSKGRVQILALIAPTRIAISMAFLFGFSECKAGSFYIDVGGGAAKMQGLGQFYGSTQDSSTSLGYNLNTGVFINLSNGSPIELQLGFLQELLTAAGNASGTSYSLLSVYPAVRIQITRLYLAAGYTPFLWRSGEANASSSTGYSRATGCEGLFGEAGLLWPITPEFSLGAAGSAQSIQSSSGNGPSPALAASVFMRFHFGYYGSGGSGSPHSNEFSGWRYPFGFMR